MYRKGISSPTRQYCDELLNKSTLSSQIVHLQNVVCDHSSVPNKHFRPPSHRSTVNTYLRPLAQSDQSPRPTPHSAFTPRWIRQGSFAPFMLVPPLKLAPSMPKPHPSLHPARRQASYTPDLLTALAWRPGFGRFAALVARLDQADCSRRHRCIRRCEHGMEFWGRCEVV
jgi:hypothetical protein